MPRRRRQLWRNTVALVQTSALREIQGISDDEKARIQDFLQGAVYCWCKNRKNEWFSMRDLMGGDNFHWEGTPLIALYAKQRTAGVPDPEAAERAGRESGWLLKRVIFQDRRSFETKEEEQIRKYQWVPGA